MRSDTVGYMAANYSTLCFLQTGNPDCYNIIGKTVSGWNHTDQNKNRHSDMECTFSKLNN